jgi:RHS repeat-associated protein
MGSAGASPARAGAFAGSFEGAGGIGGLLARTAHASTSPYQPSTSAFYHADGNGNVTYLLNQDRSHGASYRYDPYGRQTTSTGPLASANLMRFSSKPWHDHSASYYYGYRFYLPELQRWLNRDPIGEEGGINLYGFVNNAPTHTIDLFGLASGGSATLVLEPTLLLTSEEIAAALAAAAAAEAAAARERLRADCAPPNQKPRCPQATLDSLNKVVDEACSTAFACEQGDSPQVIRGKIQQIRKCLRARNLRENTCFDGGDAGHIRQLENLLQRIKNCNKKLK